MLLQHDYISIIFANQYVNKIGRLSRIDTVSNYSLATLFTGAICYAVFVECC